MYGNYDCSELWVLRRFRDNYLRQRKIGNSFIKAYYSISPIIVRYLGNNNIFKKVNRKILDKLVDNLIERGYKNMPYVDR